MSKLDRPILTATVAGILALLGALGAAKYTVDHCLFCSGHPIASSGPNSVVFPVTMTGAWQGTYRQTNTTTPVSIDINVPAGASEATVTYVGTGCSGVLDATAVDGATVTARESITHNNGCTPTGQWEFTVKTDGSLAGSYVPDARAYVATATLTRQG